MPLGADPAVAAPEWTTISFRDENDNLPALTSATTGGMGGGGGGGGGGGAACKDEVHKIRTFYFHHEYSHVACHGWHGRWRWRWRLDTTSVKNINIEERKNIHTKVCGGGPGGGGICC